MPQANDFIYHAEPGISRDKKASLDHIEPQESNCMSVPETPVILPSVEVPKEGMMGMEPWEL